MMITTFLEKTVICASFLFWTKVNLKDSLYDFDSIAYDCCIIFILKLFIHKNAIF